MKPEVLPIESFPSFAIGPESARITAAAQRPYSPSSMPFLSINRLGKAPRAPHLSSGTFLRAGRPSLDGLAFLTRFRHNLMYC